MLKKKITSYNAYFKKLVSVRKKSNVHKFCLTIALYFRIRMYSNFLKLIFPSGTEVVVYARPALGVCELCEVVSEWPFLGLCWR